MAGEKEKEKIEVSVYYAKLELESFKENWERISGRINQLCNEKEPDGETLISIIRMVAELKKCTNEMGKMATLLAKQKAYEKFLEEKQLYDEFANFAKRKES